jgi:GT2 family glycosyltransferase
VITAIIPVHNRADLLSRLLATLRAQTTPFTEIIVIDNASTDGAPDLARRHNCRVIALTQNKGFAHAVNLGWRAAGTEWVAILNSDVELDPHWNETLLGNAMNFTFATGLILDATNRNVIDGTYDLVTRSGCAWRAGAGEYASASDTKSIAIAPGTACLFRTHALRQLGGFDETYRSYLEDVDLGLRCLRAGFSGIYVPEAKAWHHGSATLGRWNPRVVRLISRNQLLLVARNYDRRLFYSCLATIVVGQLLWGLVALRHGAGVAWIAGKWEGLRAFRLDATPCPRLREFLNASEQEIRNRATGSYWRWYFRLTSSAPAPSPVLPVTRRDTNSEAP